jgi:hypothetical protein
MRIEDDDGQSSPAVTASAGRRQTLRGVGTVAAAAAQKANQNDESKENHHNLVSQVTEKTSHAPNGSSAPACSADVLSSWNGSRAQVGRSEVETRWRLRCVEDE